jgi:thiol-disulfide isomerase/thioredoxin
MKKSTHNLLIWRRIYFSILSFVVLLTSSCITITMYHRKTDDGSTSLTKTDSLAIQPFSLGDFKTSRQYDYPGQIRFQLIDADCINQMVGQQSYTWILIGASWCPVSANAMIRFSKIMQNFQADSIRLIIISQDCNISVLQQEIFNANYSFVPYLLNYAKYGKDEVYKQEKFAKDLHWDLPVKAFKGGGVPMNIIVNNKKEIKYLFGGVRVTADSIARYTGLAILK